MQHSAELGDADPRQPGEVIGFFTVDGSISDDTPEFDFVCANLTLDVIEPLLSLLSEKARKTLVLSVILVEQRSAIVSALAALGINDPEVSEAGEWVSVLVKAKKK